jgi:hypothetical protein
MMFLLFHQLISPKKTCPVKFLQFPGHPIICFYSLEGFVEGSTCPICIPPDILLHVFELNKVDKAPPTTILGLEVKWSFPSNASEADSVTTTIEGPSDNAQPIESLPLSIDVSEMDSSVSPVQGPSDNGQPHDSLPLSIPMVYGHITESQMMQTNMDHQELMKDMEVYRQYQAQGIIASPTLYQCIQPDSEQEDEDDMNLLQGVNDLVEESKAESMLELSLLDGVPTIAVSVATAVIGTMDPGEHYRAAMSNNTKEATTSMSPSIGKRRAETSLSTMSRKRAATSNSTKKAAASPSTAKKRPATSSPTTSPVTQSRAIFAQGQTTVTATAQTTSPTVATPPIVVRQPQRHGLPDYDDVHETITNPSGLAALKQEELEAKENEDVCCFTCGVNSM